MSTNGQLLFTDVDKITFKGVGNTSNAVIDTLTGKIGVGVDSPEANLHVQGNSYVSTNLELGGTLIMGTVNVEAQHSLEAITATGNTTPLTVEFTNTDTSLVASGNVEVSGNLVAEYLHGDGSNITGISQTLQAITDHGNVTSNTIQFSNVLTSFVTSSSIDIGGSVQIKNQNQNTLNADISVISPDTSKGAWYGASSWEVSKLTASDAAANDEFGGGGTQGGSIDVSGDTLVVGACKEGGSAGAVYVFTRSTTGSGWVERVKLTTSNNVGNGKFGERVRIQDDTIVVGAPSDDSNKGAVYVFTRDTPGDLTSGWTEKYKLTGGQSVGGDYFSMGLDLYGDTLIVGAYHANNGSGASGGEAYVFTRTAGNINSSWTQRDQLIPTTDHAAGDRFGNYVSLYEDTVAIGAYVDGGDATGSFYIFTRTTPGDLTSGWTERQKITAHDAASFDHYGWAISLYENTLMVSAMEENFDRGKVYVYSRTGSITSSWSHVTDLTASDAYAADRFGYELHLEKDVAVISSPRDRHPSGGFPYGAGAIYIFERNTPGLSTSSWTQIRKIFPYPQSQPTGEMDYFGDAVAMDGGTIVVSAPGDDIATDTAGPGQHTNEGSAYVYTANVSGLKLNADHVSITGTQGLAVSGVVGSSGIGALTIPSGTTAQQPTAVTGMIRFNTSLSRLEVYNGNVWQSLSGGVNATQSSGSGTTTTADGYTTHKFTSSGTFTVSAGGEVEYLIVAGGGAGATTDGGGGGAGGVVTGTINLQSGNYTITIGTGGAFVDTNDSAGLSGNDSTALGFTAIGGGGGGVDRRAGQAAKTGGSGGGGGSRQDGYGLYQYQGASGIQYSTHGYGYGNNGGDGKDNPRHSGGGGGAGEAGKDGHSGSGGGNGIQWPTRSTQEPYYGGGGGGGHDVNGPGGQGGGGQGSYNTGSPSVAGTPNTGGGGGGGGGSHSRGSSGGSGIVIIRYFT